MKISKGLKKTGNAFKKFGNDAGKFFGKGSDGSKLLGDVSRGLGQAGSEMSQASSIGNKILLNPITAGIVASNPELQPFYAGALGANTMLGLAGQGATQTSGLTRQKNYSGNTEQNLNQVLQRGKAIQKTGQEAERVQFV